MTDDLRARIVAALEECRILIPDAQADAVMAVLKADADRPRHDPRHYTSHGRCRYCGATEEAWPWPEHVRRGHRTYCKLYVGPLEHCKARMLDTFCGHTNQCTCGMTYSDREDGCPDAAMDWRGPRPMEGGAQ